MLEKQFKEISYWWWGGSTIWPETLSSVFYIPSEQYLKQSYICHYLNEMNIRLAFWKGEEKDKERKWERKRRRGHLSSMFDLIGKNIVRDKRKEPGLPTAFKQQIYGIFTCRDTLMALYHWHFLYGKYSKYKEKRNTYQH